MPDPYRIYEMETNIDILNDLDVIFIDIYQFSKMF